MHKYALMGLMYDKDKLFAIQGLASVIRESSGLTYLAGHWQEGLVCSLTWLIAPSVPSEKYAARIAPSWSWASVRRGTLRIQPNDEEWRQPQRPAPVANLVQAYLPRVDTGIDEHGLCRLKLSGPLHRLRSEASDLLVMPIKRALTLCWSTIAHWRPLQNHSQDGFFWSLHTPWLPSHLQLMEDGYDWTDDEEDDQKTESTPKKVQVNILVDNHRRSESWTLLKTSPSELSKKPSNSKCAPTTELYLLWLSVEEEFDQFPCGFSEPYRARGLLLKRVGSKNGQPICERLGTILFDHFAGPPAPDLQNIVQAAYSSITPSRLCSFTSSTNLSKAWTVDIGKHAQCGAMPWKRSRLETQPTASDPSVHTPSIWCRTVAR